MKTAVLLAALAALAMAPVAVAGDGAIEWQTDYQQALAAAQQTGKPLMVKFFATWWDPCKTLEKGAFSDADVAASAKNYINVSLDGDKGVNRPVMKKFGATGYPTVVFIDPNEKVLGRFVGVRDAATVKGDLDKYFKEYAKEAASVTWAESIDGALEAAKEDGKLVFVFFRSDKKNSKLVEKITLENINVLKALGNDYVAVKVEFDRKSETAEKYKVKSAPTMLILDAEGNLVDKVSSAKKPKQAIKFLEEGKKSAGKAKASSDSKDM